MILSIYKYYFISNLVKHIKNCSLKIAYAVSIVLVISYLALKVSWAAAFTLLWVVGFLVMLSTQYLSVSGAFITLSLVTSMFLINSIQMFFSSIVSKKVDFIQFGEYALLADNYILTFQILLDFYSLSFIILTSAIGFWALLFATNYMRGEPRIVNFIILLYFFLISMILLVSSGNFPTLMLGWELIGCFSFLLINFWTTRIGTAKSAFKAFFFNKLSDAMLILAFIVIILYLPQSFTLNFTNLYVLNGVSLVFWGAQVQILNFILVGVIVCSFCKSAQFGFHVWLPDSMEAPVPASALIHSATLVSAGIFLLGRYDIFTTILWASQIVFLWAAFTALYGGLVAAYQTDLKKILAYSTISHCGFLFVLVCYNNLPALILYLHLHGWFKSYSFMAAGNIITKYAGYQDYRRMGGSPYYITLEALVLTISISCLGGLPFTLGFFNKHYLLNLVVEEVSVAALLCIWGAAFTGLFYSVKTIYSLFGVSLKSTVLTQTLQKHGIVIRDNKLHINPSEPWPNLILLGIYPLIIIFFAMFVLNLNFFTVNLVYHSIIGVFFFLIYIIFLIIYLRLQIIKLIIGLILIKTLYVF